MSVSCGVISVKYYSTEVSRKKLLDADNVTTSKRAKITKWQNFERIIAWVFLLPHFACVLVWLFWMYNKTIIGFGIRMISRIIQTSVNVIRLSLQLRQITLTLVWIILHMLSLIQYLFIDLQYIDHTCFGKYNVSPYPTF